MKIRSGFVSNSSSSSFIIALNKKIETETDVIEDVFHVAVYDSVIGHSIYDHQMFEAGDCTQYVLSKFQGFNQLSDKEKRSKTLSEIIEHLYSYIDSDYRTDLDIPTMNVVEIFDVTVDFKKVCDTKNKFVKKFTTFDANGRTIWTKKTSQLYSVNHYLLRNYARSIYKNMIAKSPYLYVIKASDNDGAVGTFLEHSYDWKIDLIKISHH